MSSFGNGGEIVTLQFGNMRFFIVEFKNIFYLSSYNRNYETDSNYVGTHYWNFQDELLGRQSLCALPDNEIYKADKLYSISSRDKYFPRALIFDLRG